ncbi:MAG: hypothetical protein KDC68_08225 [Gelidibacter sp.]|nr:hypothetical protein [Gelidibacter sp.]
MKKQVLFSALMLIGLTSATVTAGNATTNGEDFTNTTRYRYAEPITFVERGVEFLIFPDGSFDFNTNINDSFNDNLYYKTTNTKRSSVNATFGAPGTVSRIHYSQPRSYGVLIQHDRDGKVRRIRNVFINYDRTGKVKRIGSVYMTYNRRNGRLTQVGGLRVNYNGWGEIVHASGVVNHYNTSAVYYGHNSYADTDNNDNFNDEDYYYYKQGTTVKKQKKIKR